MIPPILQSVTPSLVLKWTGVIFVVALEIIAIMALVFALVGWLK